jgi:hypothetical protein
MRQTHGQHGPDDSTLPPALARRIRRIAHRTRLCRRERALIADMLRDETAERLAAGESETEIHSSLRPKHKLARQFRRDLLRNSPLRRAGWGIAMWLKRSLAVSLLAFAVTYTLLAWRFYTQQPVLSRNIAAEHNARFNGIPDDDLAAPLYREAHAKLEKLTREERGTLDREWPEIYPNDPLWPEAVAYLDRNTDAIELVRRAAAKPYAGFRLSLRPHLHVDSEPPLPPQSGLAANPPALDLVIDSLGPYRSFARLLSVDARAAAESGDAARCTADLLAMLHLCRHSEEHEVLIGDLVSLAINALCVSTLADVLTHHPDVIDEDKLAAIELALRAYMGGEIYADIAREEEFLYDVTQRLYSDDGSGNGRLCAAGVRQLDAIANGGPGRLGATGSILGPLNAAFLPSRREFTRKYQDVLAQLQEISEQPLWEWQRQPADIIEDELVAEGEDRIRFQMLLILLPALGKAASVHETAAQTRDAALVLLALARHRLDHARYPDTLDALVPAYLPEIPPDRYDGRPIKYRLTDVGKPLLYSVGSNRADDGGVPREGDQDGTAAMKWCPPSEGHLVAPGDWIILPRPRPEPYTDDE